MNGENMHDSREVLLQICSRQEEIASPFNYAKTSYLT